MTHKIAALLNGDETYVYCGDAYATKEEVGKW